jgi:phosphomannomutase / phosphoglucomutase
VLARQPGADVIYDAKSSRHLASEVLSFGGRPIMWKTGHSLIKAKMKETGALLAGEMSGHLFIKERWYGFDDALYGCARILEILAADPRSPAEVFAELPESLSTPELTIGVPQGQHFALMQKFAAQAKFPGAKIVNVDGLRAEFEDGWGLMRPSNTQPALSFRFEGDDAQALERIQGLFREQLLALAPGLKLPF